MCFILNNIFKLLKVIWLHYRFLDYIILQSGLQFQNQNMKYYSQILEVEFEYECDTCHRFAFVDKCLITFPPFKRRNNKSDYQHKYLLVISSQVSFSIWKTNQGNKSYTKKNSGKYVKQSTLISTFGFRTLEL